MVCLLGTQHLSIDETLIFLLYGICLSFSRPGCVLIRADTPSGSTGPNSYISLSAGPMTRSDCQEMSTNQKTWNRMPVTTCQFSIICAPEEFSLTDRISLDYSTYLPVITQWFWMGLSWMTGCCTLPTSQEWPGARTLSSYPLVGSRLCVFGFG